MAPKDAPLESSCFLYVAFQTYCDELNKTHPSPTLPTPIPLTFLFFSTGVWLALCTTSLEVKFKLRRNDKLNVLKELSTSEVSVV